MNFDNHIFRSHSVGTIVNVPKPLTANQAETLADYRKRANGEGRPLTDNQKKTWHSLEHKYNQSQTYSLNEKDKTPIRRRRTLSCKDCQRKSRKS